MGKKANWLNLSQTERNDKILEGKIDLWAAHAGENLKTHARMGDDLKVLSGILKNKPVLLLGPGPSLDLAAPYLGHYTQGNLACIACNTSLNPLAARGFIPDIVVAYDPSPLVADQIEEFVAWCPHEHLRESRLICPVTIDPRVPAAWPGRVIWFLPLDNSSPANDAFHKTIKAMYPNTSQIGNCQNVFNLMIGLAQYTEALTILSVGFELPVRRGVSYGAVRYDLSKGPESGAVPLVKPHRIIDIPIIMLHRLYVAGLLHMIREQGLPFINLSPLASFREFVHTRPVSTIATGTIVDPKGEADGHD